MQLLEYFYNNTPKNSSFKNRKLRLPDGHSFLLCGARATGKTSLILDYISRLPDSTLIYIDCQDPIFALEDIDVQDLNNFVLNENIKTIVLDHYYNGFLDNLPKCFQLIIVSRETSICDMHKKYILYPLDYEEFLSYARGLSQSASFSHFLKAGTLPATIGYGIDSISLKFRELFCGSFSDDESRLMLILAKYQGNRVTVHQLYVHAREYFRISKDWIYRTIKRFQDEGIVLFIEDIEGKSARKMILYDFAFSKYLSKSQPFGVTFDAIVALALFKHNISFRSLNIHGYIISRNELVVPSAFENEEIFWEKSYNKISIYKKYNIQKVTIVTVSNSYSFILNDILFEALPFYEWSILNDYIGPPINTSNHYPY